MTINQLDRLRAIVSLLEIGYRNASRINLESMFQLEAGYGPGAPLTITSSMKSAVHTAIIENNRGLVNDCERDLISLVAELTGDFNREDPEEFPSQTGTAP